MICSCSIQTPRFHFHKLSPGCVRTGGLSQTSAPAGLTAAPIPSADPLTRISADGATPRLIHEQGRGRCKKKIYIYQKSEMTFLWQKEKKKGINVVSLICWMTQPSGEVTQRCLSQSGGTGGKKRRGSFSQNKNNRSAQRIRRRALLPAAIDSDWPIIHQTVRWNRRRETFEIIGAAPSSQKWPLHSRPARLVTLSNHSPIVIPNFSPPANATRPPHHHHHLPSFMQGYVIQRVQWLIWTGNVI